MKGNGKICPSTCLLFVRTRLSWRHESTSTRFPFRPFLLPCRSIIYWLLSQFLAVLIRHFYFFILFFSHCKTWSQKRKSIWQILTYKSAEIGGMRKTPIMVTRPKKIEHKENTFISFYHHCSSVLWNASSALLNQRGWLTMSYVINMILVGW